MKRDKYNEGLLIVHDILNHEISTSPELHKKLEKWNENTPENESFSHNLAVVTFFENFHDHPQQSCKWFFRQVNNNIEILQINDKILKEEPQFLENMFYFVTLCLLQFKDHHKEDGISYRSSQKKHIKTLYKLLGLSKLKWEPVKVQIDKKSTQKTMGIWISKIKESIQHPSPPLISFARFDSRVVKDKFLILHKVGLKLLANPDSSFVRITSSFIPENYSSSFSRAVLALPLSNTKSIGPYAHKMMQKLAQNRGLDLLFYLSKEDPQQGLRQLLRRSGPDGMGAYSTHNYQNREKVLDTFYQTIEQDVIKKQAYCIYQIWNSENFKPKNQINTLMALQDWKKAMQGTKEELLSIPKFEEIQQYVASFYIILLEEKTLLEFYQKFQED